MLSMTASSNRSTDGLDGDTAVERRRFAPDARSAGGALLRGQTTVGWRERGPREHEEGTRREPLRGYVLVDFSSNNQSPCEIQNTKAG